MKKLVLILLIVTMQKSFAQWEQTFNFELPTMSNNVFSPLTIDTDGNLVSVHYIVDRIPTYISYFIKYDTTGQLIQFKEINNLTPSLAQSIIETTDGYKIFAAAHYSPMMDFDVDVLPVIININKSGDTINRIYYYNVYDKSTYKDNSFRFYRNTQNTIPIKNNFYNVFIKTYIPSEIDSTYKQPNQHIILQCYNDSGEIIWRKGYDTLTNSSTSEPGNYNNYYLGDLSSTKFSTILIPVYMMQVDGNNIIDTKTKLIETDNQGNLLKRFTFDTIYDGKRCWPRQAIKLSENEYFILIENLKDHKFYLCKIDSSGKILINKEIIKNKRIFLERIYLTPDNKLLLTGSSLIDDNGTQTAMDDMKKLLISKFDESLNLIWDKELYEYQYGNNYLINDITFQDENNFFFAGYKGPYQFWIGKIFIESTYVNEENENQLNIRVYPNPSTGAINLRYRIETAGIANIYLTDILGNKTLIKSEYKFPGDYVETFNLNVYPQGIYNIVLQSGDMVYSDRVLILR